MEDGRQSEPLSGGPDPTGPPPTDSRAWRHPSELGTSTTMRSVAPPPLHRGVVVGTAVVTLLVVIGITRLLVPDSGDGLVVAGATTSVPAIPVIRSGTGSSGGSGDGTSGVTTTVLPASTPPTTSTDLPTTPPSDGDAVTAAVMNSGPRPATALAVQRGGLYLTTADVVGDARSVPLAIDGRRVDAGVLLVDEIHGLVVLHVASVTIDTEAIDRFVDQMATTGRTLTLGSDQTVSAEAAADAVDAAAGRTDEISSLGIEGVDTDAYAGVRVARVETDSIAARAGLSVDDVIVGFIDESDSTVEPRHDVKSLADLALDLTNRSGEDVVIVVVRQDETITVRITLGPPPSGVTDSGR